MSNSKTDRVQGELLREWRESRRMAISELASLANLSAAQIQQLESGGTHLFYTSSIKESAARKVAHLLGGDPAAVIRPGLVPEPGPDASVVDELIELSKKKAPADRLAEAFSIPLRWVVRGVALLVLALLLATAWAWYFKVRESKSVPDWGPEALAAPTPSLAKTPSPQAPERAPDASTVPRVASGTSGAEGAPPVAGVADVAVAEPRPVSALAPGATAKAVKTGLCQPAPADAATNAAPASKAKGVVYVVAQKDGAVCVVDGAGQQTVLSLKVNEAKSVYGPSPWRVHFEQSEQVHLYFQGMRVRFPDAKTTAVVMQEGERNP